MRAKATLTILAIIASVIPIAPAQSVYGGTQATGSPLVLTLLTSKFSRTSFCSMALLSERIVATAAHCVIKDQGVAPDLRWRLGDLYVSQPGADVTKDDIETRVRVLRVVTRDDFINTWKPEVGDFRTQINDIAFLFLEKPLVTGYSIEIATDDEINRAIANRDLVTHYGYGLQSNNSQTHSPWMTQLPLIEKSDPHLEKSKVMYTQEGPTAMCPGDSGGPLYIDVNGVQKIAAVLVAASGCRGNPPYTGGTLGTRIYPYLAMVEKSWAEFSENQRFSIEAEESKIVGLEQMRNLAISNGTYATPGGCHSRGINAELQRQEINGDWKTLAPALGWIDSAPSCPATHPTAPWTISKVDNGTLLRWRFWASGWDVSGEPFLWMNLSKDESSLASLDAPPKAKVTEKPILERKKSLITCKKGALTKKVSGVKPKCPKGWSKK